MDSGTNLSSTTQPGLRVRHVLVPVDFSAASAATSGAAVALAGKLGARVSFLHVLAPVTDDPEIVAHWGEFPFQRRAFAQRQLEAWQRQHAEDVAASCEVREGRPFEEIVQFAANQAVDLILLARGGEPGIIRQLLGSTVERVVRHAPCPVLVAAGEGDALLKEPGHVLLTTDFSSSALAAFPWAEMMARTVNAPITLAHVQAPMGLPGTREYAWHQEQIDALRSQAEQNLMACRADHLDPAAAVETVVVEGTPYRAVCRLAKRSSVSLIVMASRGRTGWFDALIGHTTERVVRHAPCPVLVVGSGGVAAGDIDHD